MYGQIYNIMNLNKKILNIIKYEKKDIELKG